MKGKLGQRSGYLLITYSSFICSGGTDKLGKVLCDYKIWRLCLGQRWVEVGRSGWKVRVQHSFAKVTRNEWGFLLRVLSCKELQTGSFSQKGPLRLYKLQFAQICPWCIMEDLSVMVGSDDIGDIPGGHSSECSVFPSEPGISLLHCAGLWPAPVFITQSGIRPHSPCPQSHGLLP